MAGTPPEQLKEADPALRGSIDQTLRDSGADHFVEDDTVFLKFHGIYQQDDRDARRTGKQYQFMVRTRQPGGRVSPEQYLAYADLAQQYANGTLRVTSRQGIQFHGIAKHGLSSTIRGINEALATTLAACGDVARNVMAPPTPPTSVVGEDVQNDADLLSGALLPQASAYHEIWVEGVKLDLGEKERVVDPLYGATYLPRKFKTAFVIPPLNDTDVLTNCLGFIAVAEDGRLSGYNLAVGGGLGRAHGKTETFPRLADVVGYFPRERIVEIAKAVLAIHRDWGDRTNRRHARLKYVLEDRGVDWFRAELEARVGFALAPVRHYELTNQGDPFGWKRQRNGKWMLGLHVEAGRIKGSLFRALREIVLRHRPAVRLTASQNLLLVDVAPGAVRAIDGILGGVGVQADAQGSAVRRASMACPALPTCGLALAESERWLPEALDIVEKTLEDVGLDGDEIVVRITGCPNGCARPYMAEIGLVGRAPGKYQLWFGGNHAGTRLNRVYRETVRTDELADTLRPVFQRYALERAEGERFGDFCSRSIWAGANALQSAAA